MQIRKMIIVVLLITCLVGCLNNSPSEKERIRIVVSIPPQAEFAEKIGKDKVQVAIMVPPGANPHTYEPTPSQLIEVSKAHLYAKVGSGIEFELAWMDRIADMNKTMVLVDCSHGIELIREDEPEGDEGNRYDPHIWLSPKNAVIMVENLYQGLIQIDPENKEYYKKNRDEYVRELEELDTEIEKTLSTKKNRTVMVYHPSWAYFCRDYKLQQISIQKEGKEPTPQGIAHLIQQAKQYNIRVIFASPQFNTESAEVIAREIGGRVVLIDPLEKNYVENMRKIAEAFAGG